MTVRSVPFFSDRYLLDAEIHLPEGANAAAPCPVIVACSGFEGLKTIHPERFARVFTPRGYAVLAFDYRGFGFSEGERGRIVAQEWTEDVRAAIGILSTIPEIDTQRITLLGWGAGRRCRGGRSRRRPASRRGGGRQRYRRRTALDPSHAHRRKLGLATGTPAS